MARVSIERAHTAPDKKPTSVVDYVFDWSLFLKNENITDSVLTSSDPALVVSEKIRSSQAVVAVVSGGEDGQTYCFENRITSNSGEIETQVIRQRVRSVSCP